MKTDLRKQFEEETKASESIDIRYVSWLENKVRELRDELNRLNKPSFTPNTFVNPTPYDSRKDDLVPYWTTCSCNPINGGDGVCGCVMGDKLVSRGLITKTTNITFPINIDSKL
jgi:hypothetical protein